MARTGAQQHGHRVSGPCRQGRRDGTYQWRRAVALQRRIGRKTDRAMCWGGPCGRAGVFHELIVADVVAGDGEYLFIRMSPEGEIAN